MADKYWLGNSYDALATTNWLGGAVPVAGDTIQIDSLVMTTYGGSKSLGGDITSFGALYALEFRAYNFNEWGLPVAKIEPLGVNSAGVANPLIALARRVSYIDKWADWHVTPSSNDCSVGVSYVDLVGNNSFSAYTEDMHLHSGHLSIQGCTQIAYAVIDNDELRLANSPSPYGYGTTETLAKLETYWTNTLDFRHSLRTVGRDVANGVDYRLECATIGGSQGTAATPLEVIYQPRYRALTPDDIVYYGNVKVTSRVEFLKTVRTSIWPFWINPELYSEFIVEHPDTSDSAPGVSYIDASLQKGQRYTTHIDYLGGWQWDFAWLPPKHNKVTFKTGTSIGFLKGTCMELIYLGGNKASTVEDGRLSYAKVDITELPGGSLFLGQDDTWHTSAAEMTFAFSGTATLNSEIELIDTAGAQRTYQFKDSVTSGQADGTDGDGHPRILVDRGSSASDSSLELGKAIRHANGHNGTILTHFTNLPVTAIILKQLVVGVAGNTTITLDQTSGVDFTTNTNPNPPAAFTGGVDSASEYGPSLSCGIEVGRIVDTNQPTRDNWFSNDIVPPFTFMKVTWRQDLPPTENDGICCR